MKTPPALFPTNENEGAIAAAVAGSHPVNEWLGLAGGSWRMDRCTIVFGLENGRHSNPCLFSDGSSDQRAARAAVDTSHAILSKGRIPIDRGREESESYTASDDYPVGNFGPIASSFSLMHNVHRS